MRIAMWSGPRNISTALMRAWENRPDTIVIDEPFYACYLASSGAQHPGREEIIKHHETDWTRVSATLTAPLPDGTDIFYQKHMAHHLLPECPRDWLEQVVSCFLIRDPNEMVTSFIRTIPNPRSEDLGLPQQVELFHRVRETTGRTPIVLDARDVLLDPERMLRLFCESLALPFSDSMLNWPSGPRESDGIWAKYWYTNVEQSTGFQAYRSKDDRVPESLKDVLDECMRHYQYLHQHRLC